MNEKRKPFKRCGYEDQELEKCEHKKEFIMKRAANRQQDYLQCPRCNRKMYLGKPKEALQ